MKFLNDRGYPYSSILYGVFRDEKRTEVVSSYATEGDLFFWASHHDRPPVGQAREEVMRPLVVQVLTAVQMLHDLSIAHHDLSLENILVTKNGNDSLQLKIIDLAMISTERYFTGYPRGKRSYQAPELHDEEGYHDAFLADVFSVGVCVLHACQ